MLVLSRKIEQSIVLTCLEDIPAGTQIVVKHVGHRGAETKFGIEAPQSIRVERDELLPPERKQR